MINDYGLCNYYNDTARVIPRIDKWIRKVRSKFGAICIPTSSPLREVMKMHQKIENSESNLKGLVLGALLDTESTSSHHEYEMLGRKFFFTDGVERIGKKIGAAFVYAHIQSNRRGFYDVTFQVLNTDENGSYMPAYIHALEKNIKEQPELWLMWSQDNVIKNIAVR